MHTGEWAFRYGVDATDGEVRLSPGDTISIPPMMFRGFENVGEDVGFLFAVLGGDDPGKVTWAPRVFELARDHGLVLLEGGRLVDTAAGETVPEGARRQHAPDAQTLLRLASADPDRLAGCVARADGLGARGGDPAVERQTEEPAARRIATRGAGIDLQREVQRGKAPGPAQRAFGGGAPRRRAPG